MTDEHSYVLKVPCDHAKTIHFEGNKPVSVECDVCGFMELEVLATEGDFGLKIKMKEGGGYDSSQDDYRYEG